MIIKVAGSFIGKLFLFKKGSLVLVSSALSAGTLFYINEMLKGTEVRHLVIPIFTHIVGFCFFFLFVLLDLATGLWNAKYQNEISAKPQKNYIKSHKLYRTFWKSLGVLLFTSLIMFLCLFTEIIDSDYMYAFTLWALVTVWLMASGFEFHSIGENIEKRTGDKPEIFGFMDKILDAIQRRALRKIDTVGEENQCEIKEQPTEEVEENEEEAVKNTN